jgi:NAD(P)-dependent dehydrogenase (short-subunit alcohol dehydrogenase family)
MKQVIVITGASTGFGALAARALVQAGHTVYATMRETTGRNAPQVAEAEHYAAEHGVDLRTVELDVAAAESVEAGIAKLIADTGRLDVVIHNAGHMSFGPAEAFTPEQFAELFSPIRGWRSAFRSHDTRCAHRYSKRFWCRRY